MHQVSSILNENAATLRTATDRHPTSPSQQVGTGCREHCDENKPEVLLIFCGWKHLGLAMAKQLQASQLGGESISTPTSRPQAKADQLEAAAAGRAVSAVSERWEESQRKGVRGPAGGVCRLEGSRAVVHLLSLLERSENHLGVSDITEAWLPPERW